MCALVLTYDFTVSFAKLSYICSTIFPHDCSMGGVFLSCCACACIDRHSSKIWLVRWHRLDNTQDTIELSMSGGT